MPPVTAGEKYRAFYRCKSSSEELLMYGIIDLKCYKQLLEICIKQLGHPNELSEKMIQEELNGNKS